MSESKRENSFLKAVKNIIGSSSLPAANKKEVYPHEMLSSGAKVFEKLKQPCFIFGSDKKIVYANPAFCALFGIDCAPSKLEEILTKKDLKTFLPKVADVFNLEESVSFALNFSCGKKTLGAAADFCYFCSAGGVKYVAVTLKDCFEKTCDIRFSDKSASSCDYLRILFASVPTSLYVRDRSGKVIMHNTAANEILGLEENQNLLAFNSASLKEDLKNDKEVFSCGCLWKNENLSFKDVSGATRCARIVKVPLREDDGKLDTVLTMFEDITGRKKQEEDVLSMRNLLQTILDYAPMAVYTRDASGNLTFWNKKTIEIFEDSEENLVTGKNKNSTKEKLLAYCEREESILKEGKVIVSEEEPYTTGEGSDIMLNLVKVPIPAIGENPACVLTIAQDITDKYMQEQETFKTQNIIQTIFNNAPVAIYARDEKGELLFRNKKTLEIHGYTEDEAVNEREDQKEFYKKREQAVIKSAKTLDLPEEEYIGADGKKRFIHAVKAPVFDADGKPLMVITIGEDISSARDKEKEIIRSKNFLQEVINNLPVALFAKKYTGEYILWNKKSEELFGKKAAEVIGKTHHNDEINPEQEEFVRMQEQKVFDVGREVDIPQELISTQKDGIKIMHTVKTPLFYEDGTPNCLLGVSEDITAKTKMERQIYEAKTKYSLLVESSREGILITENGKISFANKTLLADLGYQEGELDGKIFTDLAAQENQSIASEFYDKVFAGTAARNFAVIKLQNKNRDEVVEYEISAALSKYLGKKILIMFLRNITKEHRLEEVIKTKDDKFRQAFESARTPFVLLQHNGYVYEMNASARDLLGFTKEDKPLYCSIYIKPGLPLDVRKAMENIDECKFLAKVDFDKVKKHLQGIVKNGTLELDVTMTPVNQRELSNGRVVADYLMELTQKTNDEGLAAVSENSVIGEDMLACQDAVLLCDRSGFVLKCNVKAEKLFNLSFNKIQGRMLSLFFSQGDTSQIEADIKELYTQGSIKSRSYSLKVSGGLIPVEAYAVLAKNNNFLISLRNTSARLQLIDTLRERSQYLQALYNVIDAPLLECEIKDGSFMKFDGVNAPACAVSGYSKDELEGLSLSDLLAGADKKEEKKVKNYLSAKIEQLKRDKMIYFEANLRVKDRNMLAFVRISYFDVLGKQKALITLKDTTKEIVLESKLNDQTKELEGIKEALPGLYLKVDSKGYIQEYKTSDMSYNIAVFPTDFVNKNPYDILDKETADSLIAAIGEALKTDQPVHVPFSMQYGTERRFYEASISRIQGEENVVVLLRGVDKHKGLADKVRHLYSFSSNREAGFVDNMREVLEFGKQIYNAQAGLVCHFSGANREKVLINYVTPNDCDIKKGIEAPIGECFEKVRGGEVYFCADTAALGCKECLHKKADISSIISAPLYVEGEVQGAVCFVTVGQRKLAVSDEDKNFMGSVGGLMGLALELRQNQKATDNAITTLRKLISSLDSPACITDKDFGIKNMNEVMRAILGITDIAEEEGKNLFARFALEESKAESDFNSAQKTSKGGAFDFIFDIMLVDGHSLNLIWHAVELKDGKGKMRGYFMVSESIKDMPQLRNIMQPPVSHI